ncbi:Acetyltransferase (GNAT) domain-containing protein [Salibacterium qingdaonense]|uniref:Acetyltransferase (GNAT) domain-containing protein n=1 Tax=Salibacterium qingdaonense TaxID=266892 RepID=A0A1I4IIE7_9BACI|nr:Acetyltransferase (GNAT) domain-containing protein [Salibacterium qingdaonense]
MNSMNWYDKLNQYFPVEEMKSKEHMELLLQEQGDIYHKEEGPDYVMMYVEMEGFIFIDYLFVSRHARGKGTGMQLIEKLKQRKKPVILEVEPLDYEDTDSRKRFRFYERAGFRRAASIGYNRRSLATDKINTLEIMFWSPEDESEEKIFEKLKQTYKNVHTYKDKELYGKSYEPAEEVLSYDQSKEQWDIIIKEGGDKMRNKDKQKRRKKRRVLKDLLPGNLKDWKKAPGGQKPTTPTSMKPTA